MKFTYVYCFLTHPEVSWPLSHLPPFGKVPGVLSCKQHGPFVLALFSPLSYTLGLTVKSSDWVSGWCWVIHNLHASLCCIRTIQTEHTSHTRKTDTVNPVCEGKQKPHTVNGPWLPSWSLWILPVWLVLPPHGFTSLHWTLFSQTHMHLSISRPLCPWLPLSKVYPPHLQPEDISSQC